MANALGCIPTKTHPECDIVVERCVAGTQPVGTCVGEKTRMRTKMRQDSKLIDRFGRVHTDLRLSITDRCNIRCKYCMPHEDIVFLPRQQLLSYEEIQRFVRIVAGLGVKSVRITGGEPLVRTDVPKLVSLLNQIEGIEDIALTTNGMLLVDQAHDLRQAGLRRVNISLDTLQEEKFFQLSRRHGLDRVLNGIAAAQDANFHTDPLECHCHAQRHRKRDHPAGEICP